MHRKAHVLSMLCRYHGADAVIGVVEETAFRVPPLDVIVCEAPKGLTRRLMYPYIHSGYLYVKKKPVYGYIRASVADMPRKTKNPASAPRLPLSLRVTPEIRGALESAAIASGRSISQEAEQRLENSFSSRPPPHIEVLANVVAQVAQLVETLASGKTYVEDNDTALTLASALRDIISRVVKPRRTGIGDMLKPRGHELAEQENWREKAGNRVAEIAELYLENGADLTAELPNIKQDLNAAFDEDRKRARAARKAGAGEESDAPAMEADDNAEDAAALAAVEVDYALRMVAGAPDKASDRRPDGKVDRGGAVKKTRTEP